MKLIKVKYSVKWPARVREHEMLVHSDFNFDKFFNDERVKLIEKIPVEIQSQQEGYYFDAEGRYKFDPMSDDAALRASARAATGQNPPDYY